jgi:putative endonuclease
LASSDPALSLRRDDSPDLLGHHQGGVRLLKTYYVYMMANRSRTLYTGVTNSLSRRVLEHKQKLVPGFTSHYSLKRLLYFETFGDIRAAIQREKQIKGWLREKKLALIASKNPTWEDLSMGWYGKADPGA